MRLFVLTFLFCSNVSFGQITNQLTPDSSDIYVHALNQYCERIIQHSPKSNTIYIEQGKFFSNILPDKVKTIEIKKVSKKDISKACRNEKNINILEIIPLRSKDDVFYVGIITFKVFLKKKHFHYINEGGINFNYLYNKDTGQFSFINPKVETH